jgi:hypothetical protein
MAERRVHQGGKPAVPVHRDQRQPPSPGDQCGRPDPGRRPEAGGPEAPPGSQGRTRPPQRIVSGVPGRRVAYCLAAYSWRMRSARSSRVRGSPSRGQPSSGQKVLPELGAPAPNPGHGPSPRSWVQGTRTARSGKRIAGDEEGRGSWTVPGSGEVGPHALTWHWGRGGGLGSVGSPGTR